MANTNTTYTLKHDPAKYANLHSCDAKYWHPPIDFAKPCNYKALQLVWDETFLLLEDILKAKAFKPENLKLAEELKALHESEFRRMWLDDEATGEPVADVSEAEQTFIVYQLWRYTMRLWYRDTRAAREATRPAPAKQEKAKAPAKQEKPKTEKKPAPAKQEIAKANEATFVSKLTKAQKKELLLTLMAELLK